MNETFGTLTLSKDYDLITLTVANGIEVRITDELLTLFGLDNGCGGKWMNNGIHKGDHPLNVLTRKLLNIHLDHTITTENILNCSWSALITSIRLVCQFYGDVDTVYISYPAYERLTGGITRDLDFSHGMFYRLSSW